MARIVPLLAAAAVTLLSVAATTGASTARPAFSFGRSGGNIARFTLAIATDGKVTATGRVELADPRHRVPAGTLRSLVDLAYAVRFSSLPASIRCPGALPDVATDFVTVRNALGATTVREHGSCNPRFRTLYGALVRAAAVR